MENVKAILVANSDAGNLTFENFNEMQQTLHNPMVIFMKEGTNEVVNFFHIAANTMEDLNFMFKHKYFDTPDLPEKQYQKFMGAYFVGVGKDDNFATIAKEKATVLVTL